MQITQLFSIVSVTLFLVVSSATAVASDVPTWASKNDCSTIPTPTRQTVQKNPQMQARKILRNGYLAAAKNWFGFAEKRAARDDVTKEICRGLQYAVLGNITPDEIGVEAKKLHYLQWIGYQSAAKKWLQLAEERSVIRDVSPELEKARAYADKAGIDIAGLSSFESPTDSDGDELDLVSKELEWPDI